MKRYALLRLQHNANKVVVECNASTLAEAVNKFRRITVGVTLDDTGYGKLGEDFGHVSFCVAEFHEAFCQIP